MVQSAQSFTLKKIKLPCYNHDKATLSNSHLITFDLYYILTHALVQKMSSAFICLRLCVCVRPTMGV